MTNELLDRLLEWSDESIHHRASQFPGLLEWFCDALHLSSPPPVALDRSGVHGTEAFYESLGYGVPREELTADLLGRSAVLHLSTRVFERVDGWTAIAKGAFHHYEMAEVIKHLEGRPCDPRSQAWLKNLSAYIRPMESASKFCQQALELDAVKYSESLALEFQPHTLSRETRNHA